MRDLTGRTLSEKEIQSMIISAISYLGKVYNITTGVFAQGSGNQKRFIRTFPKGTPDLLGFRYSDGKIFFIEVKKEKGLLSPEQKQFREWVLTTEALYGVARSVEDALLIIQGKWDSAWDIPGRGEA